MPEYLQVPFGFDRTENREGGASPPRAQRCKDDGRCIKPLAIRHTGPGRRIDRLNPSQKTGQEIIDDRCLAASTFPQGESMESPFASPVQDFSDAERAAVYHAIFSRRDVRGQFLSTPVPDEALSRILMAAHHAPSVGFMQPWNFLLIRSPAVKHRVHSLFAKANEEAAAMFDDQRREAYSRLKLEGILQAPISVCITCDRQRTGPVVLGRTHMQAMDLYSSVCAVQNLWLAARAEGLGLGWVSIFNAADLKELLGIPDHIELIAYLCIGYVSHFNDKPELEKAGWLPRLPIEELLFHDQWGELDQSQPLTNTLREMQANIQKAGLFPR